MTPQEQGFLLLTCRFGIPERPVLSTSQLRTLWNRVGSAKPVAEDRELEERDLMALGYGREFSRRILTLLCEEDLLEAYLKRGKRSGCIPLPLPDGRYPMLLRQRLGHDVPGSLWMKGDSTLLGNPGISLVGSRELLEPNRAFAAEVGRQAARQGLCLISGNARGADREAQQACLDAGGQVISIVADELWNHPFRKNVLYLSEDGFDEPFSSRRALSRNRCIHAMGIYTFVAQSGLGRGGTWSGTTQNLRQSWSPVICFRDGSESAEQLEQMGAYLVGIEDLADFSKVPMEQTLWNIQGNFD